MVGDIYRPVGRYQILGGHTLNGAQILGGHNHYFTTKCSKYWVGTCPCAPLAPTGLLSSISNEVTKALFLYDIVNLEKSSLYQISSLYREVSRYSEDF